MSNYKEISNAVKIFDKKIILLQCSSIYPCPLDQVGINVINEFFKNINAKLVFQIIPWDSGQRF